MVNTCHCAPRDDGTAIAWLINLAESLSWLHLCRGCHIINDYEPSAQFLCKLNLDIVLRKCSAHVVGHLGGLCWKAAAISHHLQSYLPCPYLPVFKIWSLPGTAELHQFFFWDTLLSGEITSWICSLLTCKDSITTHRERLFNLYLFCPICVPVTNPRTKLCAVPGKCSTPWKPFLTTNTSPASASHPSCYYQY